jgi:hypothetical protein
MLPPDIEHYLDELSRVLVAGGRCLVTYCLLNDASRSSIEAGRSRLSFRYERTGCWIDDDAVPESAVAYDERRIRDLYRDRTLEIEEPIRYGTWSGLPDGLSYQDLVVAWKEARPASSPLGARSEASRLSELETHADRQGPG